MTTPLNVIFLNTGTIPLFVGSTGVPPRSHIDLRNGLYDVNTIDDVLIGNIDRSDKDVSVKKEGSVVNANFECQIVGD
ncbi:hypothetical protein AMATHDRAFT_57129 [Amanita thiersii Skay4041]|uniref:Uncharacterized protein n=1 Tax=Amanita thiersii Skay4041 TaxID=703135 RepID=A0A2A9NXJ8_9AGAR|nr:hypothetical protein AMATHDRAFT_57129 [Amanita thiersii Skay4041]